MPELCVIAPIGLHPRFVRVRPLRFRHENGAVIARTGGIEERLCQAQALACLRSLDRDIRDHDCAGRAYAAVQARADRRDLVLACHELRNGQT